MIIKEKNQTKEDSWRRSLHARECRRRPSFCFSFLLWKSIGQM